MVRNLIAQTRCGALVCSEVVCRTASCECRRVLLTAQTCSVHRLVVVCLFVECVVVARYVLSTEVEHKCRVECYATEACLEVEVRTCASSGVTTESDHFARAYFLVFLYELLREVTVDCLQTVVMAYHDILAVAATLVAHDAHLAREGCAYGVADVHLDVETFVLASPTRTEVAGDDAACGRHREVTKVDIECFGQLCGAVCVLVVPVCIEVCCGRFEFFAHGDVAKHNCVDGCHLTVYRCLACKKVLCVGGCRSNGEQHRYCKCLDDFLQIHSSGSFFLNRMSISFLQKDGHRIVVYSISVVVNLQCWHSILNIALQKYEKILNKIAKRALC